MLLTEDSGVELANFLEVLDALLLYVNARSTWERSLEKLQAALGYVMLFAWHAVAIAQRERKAVMLPYDRCSPAP